MNSPSGKIPSVRGTRDFYPEAMRFQNFIFKIWKSVSRRYGFEEYDGPILEHLDLFTRKSGDEIVGQLYHFKDKSDRDLALRPELTPTLARMVAEKGPALKLPLKWFSIPRCFRYERMMRGRLREFFQFNMDIVGVEGIQAEAEILAAMVDVLTDLGLKHSDFKIKISNRALFFNLFKKEGFSDIQIEKMLSILDKKDKLDEKAFKDFFIEKGFNQSELNIANQIFSLQSLEEIKPFPEIEGALRELKDLIELMADYGCENVLEFSPSVVRGLAYYSGIVFEIFDTGNTLRAIAGGGRYNNLVKVLGGAELPAVGVAMGDVVIGELLKEKKLLQDQAFLLDVFVVRVGGKNFGEMIQLVQELRKQNFSVNFNLKNQNFKKQINQASQLGARYVIFFGSDQEKPNSLEIKDMGSGEQKVLSRENFISLLKDKGTH